MSQAPARQKVKGKRQKAGLTGCVLPLLVLSACATPPRTTAAEHDLIVLSPVRVTQEIAATALPLPTVAQRRTAPSPRPSRAPTNAPFVSAWSPTPLPVPTDRPARTVVPAPSATPRPTTPPTPTPLTATQREQVFQQVWQIVRDDYLYKDYNGTDWEAIREEYAPRIASAETNEQFYTELIEMVARLNDHHSRFGPPAVVLSEDAVVSGREATVGIGVQTVPLGDSAFVQAVFPDSPAASVLRPRDRIVAVDGHSYQYADGNLEGRAGSTVRLTVVTPGEKPRDVLLTRRAVQARVVPYSRRFPGEIGYVAVSTLWVSDTDEQVSGALTELVADGAVNGVILDLRGNPGGWSHVMNGILSHFVRGQVGSFSDRRGHARPLVIAAPAGPDLRRVPLSVLIDADTSSYAEVIAAVLQREARAQVVGMASAGNTETIYAHTLNDGSRLWLAQEGFKLQSGTSLEGSGVQPDVLVEADWRRFSEEDDPQLLEALRLLGAGPK